MPGINWGMQQPIQPPSVVAQLPQQSNGMDNFAEGLLSGIAKGQQIQSNNINLGQQRQQVADQQELRKAAAEGGDKWMQTLIGQGKVDEAMQYQVHQAQYQNALLQNKASVMELSEKQRAIADRDNTINVSVMGAVSQLPPEQRDAAYQQYKADLQKQYPGIVMPDKFDANSMASVMRVNEVIQRSQTAEATEKVKTLSQLQSQRDALVSAKQAAIAENKPTENIDQRLKEVQDLINTHTKNVQTTKQEVYGSNLDENLAKQDATSAKEAGDLRTNMETLHNDATEVLRQLPNVPDLALGPIAKGMGLDKLSPEAQKIISPLNAMALQLKDYYKLGSGQGFTDADRDFLTEIAGKTGYYKYSLKSIVERMDRIAGAARYNAWKRESNIRKRGSGYDAWLDANPEPPKEWEKSKEESAKVTPNTSNDPWGLR